GTCAGSNGTRMQVAADGAAHLGNTLRVDGHGTLPGTLAIFDISFARDASGATSLPAELPSVGLAAPDCFFLVAPQVTVASLADAAGGAPRLVPIRLLPPLVGVSVYAQWYAFDAAANAFGLVTSNAIELAIQ